MKMRLWIGVVAAFTLLSIGTVSADWGDNLTVNTSDYATVSVNLSYRVMVDISPNILSWADVEPGGIGDNNSEGRNFYAVQIENIGSHNISYVWFNASFPTSNPFGVGSTANTDSGNYVVLANDTAKTSDNEPFYFVNRVEFNATQQLVYLTDPEGSMPPDGSKFLYGRFRNASSEYFWMTNNATNGFCNESTYIRVGIQSHTKTQTGSVDFSDGGNDTRYIEATLTTAGEPWNDYAYADMTAGPLAEYCIAVSQDCKVYFARWNKDAPFHLCNNVKYAWDFDDRDYLVPGNSFAMKIKAYVPYGIYEGPSTPGTLTVIVNDIGT